MEMDWNMRRVYLWRNTYIAAECDVSITRTFCFGEYLFLALYGDEPKFAYTLI